MSNKNVLTIKGWTMVFITVAILLVLFSGLFIAGNTNHGGAFFPVTENSFRFDGDQLVVNKVAWYEGNAPKHTHIVSPDGHIHMPVYETPTTVAYQLSPGKLDPIGIGWKLIAKR